MNIDSSRSRALRPLLVVPLVALSMMSAVFACSEGEEGPATEDAAPTPGPFDLPDASPKDASTQGDATLDLDASRCTDSGFCLTPLPTLEPLVALAASSVDDAWAVTADDVLRWDGASWKTVYRSPDARYFGITVQRPDDVWVVGRQHVVRYSARGASPAGIRVYPGGIQATDDTTTGFWVSPTGDELWIVINPTFGPAEVLRYREEFGDGGGGLVEDPMTTAAMGFPWPSGSETFTVYSVFGFAPDDVYVGGLWCTGADCSFGSEAKHYGAIAHYDGKRFTKVSQLGERERVSAIYGTTAADSSRQLWIWAGVGGEPESSIRLLPSERDGTVGPARYSVPVRTSPGSFSTIDSAWQGCHRVQGSIPSSTKAWFSNLCLVYRWNGTALEVVPTALRDVPMGTVTGIWAGSDEDVWLVGAAPSPIPSFPNIGYAALRRGSP